jgi:hypothetical protein
MQFHPGPVRVGPPVPQSATRAAAGNLQAVFGQHQFFGHRGAGVLAHQRPEQPQNRQRKAQDHPQHRRAEQRDHRDQHAQKGRQQQRAKPRLGQRPVWRQDQVQRGAVRPRRPQPRDRHQCPR